MYTSHIHTHTHTYTLTRTHTHTHTYTSLSHIENDDYARRLEDLKDEIREKVSPNVCVVEYGTNAHIVYIR